MWKHASILVIICIVTTACANQATSVPASTPTIALSLVTFFPQSMNNPPTYMEALIKGDLILSNGCLRVEEPNGNSVLLIWRPGFSVREEQGIVQVMNNTGQVAAGVGDFVEIGGGDIGNPTVLGLTEPLPEGCPGPYWVVGESIKKIGRP